MNDETEGDNPDFYKIERGDPYVKTSNRGKEAIVRDEVLFKNGVEVSYIEEMVDDDPSEQEKFKIRLTNPR